MARFALHLLGSPRIERDGEPVPIRRRKALALLAFLAVDDHPAGGKVHNRDTLATLLWPEWDQSRARAGLRRNLSTLRRMLGGEWLVVEGETVGLEPHADVWVDVDRFHTLLRAWEEHGHAQAEVCPACLAALAEAVELYQGDFMAGFSLRDSASFDEWQFFQSEGLRRELGSALERLARSQATQGAYDTAIPYARRWLALDPLHEPAHRHLMRLYAWSGQRAAGLRQYAECERLLREELGTPPEEKTTQLFGALKERREPPPPCEQAVTPISSETDALHDRYRLDAELGRGGTSVVYRARDTLLDRDVAVKVLSDSGLGEQGRARLLGEACAAAALNHPNIVSVYDAGEAGGLPFIVMELMEGKSLYDLRVAGDRQPAALDETLVIVRQVCSALAHAHAHGIVHRDLKPENVLLTQGGTAKLADFGLARPVASRLTSEGGIFGSVFYLAPELALGQPFDGRADLYALGVILYELATGRLPFTGDDPLAVISQHLHASIVPPRARNPGIPPALDALILRLLKKRPEERPGAAADVLQILDAPDLLCIESVAGEELSVLDRIERGRLVGRERELGVGRGLWNQVLSGQGRVLLISGEPGVGKSRLVQELVTRVRVAGDRALVGACYAEGGMPYAPFAQILRRAFRDGAGDNLNLPQFVLADLVTLAPALRLRFPDVPLSPSTPLRAGPPADPQAEQQRLFESAVAFFTALSEQTPLLLVLEDAHWGDSGTLSLLRHLARRTRRQRVLLVATYREGELDEARPFGRVLLDLHRERLAERLKLPRLDLEGTEGLLTVLFDEETTPEFLDGIYRVTEGNPFFIEEVCKALLESGEVYFADGRWGRPSMEEMKIPQSVRVAIESRVGKLPQAAQETLRLAAVLGREFDFETLVEASALAGAGDQDEDTLVNALEAAERAQLIGEVSAEGGGTFAFTHALIPATLVESLSGLRRRRMHRQGLAAIERLRPDDWEALAYHALEAGNLPRGLDYSLRAGEKAQRLYALADALPHYEHAREIAAALDLPEQLLTVYEAMGDMLFFREYPKSVHAFEQALNLASDEGRRAAIKSKIGQMLVLIGDERGLAFSEAAIEELDPDTQGNELAGAIGAVGRFHHNRGHDRQALTHFERARRIAEPLDEPLVLFYLYAYLAGAHQQLAEHETSLAWARRAVALGERQDYPQAMAGGYTYLAQTSACMGNWQDALRFAEQAHQAGERAGNLAAFAWAEHTSARAYYGLGDLPAAQEAARKSLHMAEGLGDSRLAVWASAQLSMAQAGLGQVEVAEQNAMTAVERALGLNYPSYQSLSLHALAQWHVQRGEWEKAFECLHQSAHVLAETDDRDDLLQNGPLYAESCLVVGRPEKAAEVVEETLALAVEAPSLHIEAVARRVQAQILAAQGAWDEAIHAFDGAITQLEELGSRLELGRALYHLGETQAKRGQVDAAHASLTRALETFQDCSAVIDAERARAALNSLEAGA